MNQELFALMLLIGIALLMGGGIVALVVKKKRWGNFASLTAFHDFQPKDKQAGIEMVIEKKASKKMEEQESGEDNN